MCLERRFISTWAMDDLVTQGKLLYVGISEWREWKMVEAAGLAVLLYLDPIVVNQPEYNLFIRRIESDIVPMFEKLALVWNLRLLNISRCIIGATRPKVEQNASASGISLTDDLVSVIEKILTEEDKG